MEKDTDTANPDINSHRGAPLKQEITLGSHVNCNSIVVQLLQVLVQLQLNCTDKGRIQNLAQFAWQGVVCAYLVRRDHFSLPESFQ